MKSTKYICPKCHQAMSDFRYDSETAICVGLTVKCKKCSNIVEISINCHKTVDK